MMAFRSICNLMFPWFNFSHDLSDDLNRDVDHESPGFDSYDHISDSFRAVHPVKSYKGVCKISYEMDSCCCVSELPDLVIHEILLRLPLESIIRCYRVSKGWSHLISEPYFGNVYFNNSPFNAIAISQHRSYNYPFDHDQDQCSYSYNYVEIGKNCEMNVTPLNLEALLTSPVKGMAKEKGTKKIIIGSCDGLLFVVESDIPWEKSSVMNVRRILRVTDSNHIVWIINPLIGEYISLPKAGHVANNVNVVYGFGSTVNGDQRKVIRVAMEAEAHIFTIGVDEKWRDLDTCFFPPQLYPHEIITLNGILHWVGVGAPNTIYTLDIEEEKGYCLTYPCEVGHWSQYFYLGVWDGHLCLTDNSNQFQHNIWTMKQYGVVESWSQLVIVRDEIPRYYSLIPVTTMNNGDLLLTVEYHGTLISLNSKTKKVVEIESSSDLDGTYTLFSYAYDPSFLNTRSIIFTG